MEECREDKIATVLSWLQAGARGKASRIEFKKLGDERKALVACQNAMKARQMEKSWKWMELWNLIRPTLKCTNFCKFQETYEAQIKEAEANIGKAVKECKEVTEKWQKLDSEKQELASVLASGDSAVQDVIEKTNRAEAQRNEVLAEVRSTEARLQNEEDMIVNINGAADKATAEAEKLKSEMRNIENSCAMLEEDKATKDRQNRSLKREEIQIAEDRCNHLAKVKLGDSLDEAEDALERERKSKGGVEKIKRKLNGDLKLTQEAVTSLECIKANLYQTSMRKEK